MQVVLDGVCKRYGNTDGPPVLADVNLNIGDGQILAVMGPSGSGKSTLLSIIAGLEKPTAGRLAVRGTWSQALSVSPDRFLVTQSPALFGWMDVRANVAFALRYRRGLSRHEQQSRIAQALAMVELADWADSSVHVLSGGMKQRVALARAVALDPPVLLLDEPFTGLHESLRLRLAARIAAQRKRPGRSTVLVTHHCDEARLMADVTVAVDPGTGRVVQESTSESYPAVVTG